MSKWKRRFEALKGDRAAKSEQEVALEDEVRRLKCDADRGRLVIMYAKSGEHLVPMYDELVRDANVSVNHDYVDAVSVGETRTYIVGPSTITIRVTR